MYGDATIEEICAWRKCHRLNNFFGNVFMKKQLRDMRERLIRVPTSSIPTLEWALEYCPYVRVEAEDIELLLKAMVRGAIVRKSRRRVRVRMLKRTIFLKKHQKIAKDIPPLARPSLEQRLSKENLEMISSLVGGECKYEKMFEGPFYPKEENRCDAMPTRKDRIAMQELVDADERDILYSASW